MADIRKLDELQGAELLAAMREIKAGLAPFEHLAMNADGRFVIVRTVALTPKGEG